MQHQGRPDRPLCILDFLRVALLLLGGDKTGDDRSQSNSTTTTRARSRRQTTPKMTKFGELRSKMSPKASAEARLLAEAGLRQTPLHELRAARQLTQQQLAQALNITQAAVARLEQRTDVYVSTLGNFIEAMGGQLEQYAVFADEKVRMGLDRERP